jgi:hypothetical protein
VQIYKSFCSTQRIFSDPRREQKEQNLQPRRELISPVLEFAWAREINSVETLIFHFSSLSGESLRDPHPFLSRSRRYGVEHKVGDAARDWISNKINDALGHNFKSGDKFGLE